jgi:ABC-2 type transport system ATP-binding protein
MEKLIIAQNLTKRFGDTTAVSDLSLQVRAGEIYGLVGPDGAGKTTTMRLLCGALTPDSGKVIIGGQSMLKSPDRAREQLGYLSQKFSLYKELTVLENIRFFAEVRGIPSKEWRDRTIEILEFVGLAEFVDRRAGYLSGGMKQKLGLASALVHRPQILLLDEPTGGVDPVTRQDFWQLIIQLVNQERVSVLVSTPYMDEAGGQAQCASQATRWSYRGAARGALEGTPTYRPGTRWRRRRAGFRGPAPSQGPEWMLRGCDRQFKRFTKKYRNSHP